MSSKEHRDWLEREYGAWEDALRASTVDNFRDNPIVQRMLCEPKGELFDPLLPTLTDEQLADLQFIDRIGFTGAPPAATGLLKRHVFYAAKVIEQNPSGIVEIGGGLGHFLAVLVALGWRGDYQSLDRFQVRRFQENFLQTVQARTGLPVLRPLPEGIPFVVSFYALGEFDDETKKWFFRNVIEKSEHGMVVWNPHSGASREIPFPCKVETEQPLTGLGNKLLTW